VQGAIPGFTNNVTTIYIAQRISAVIDLDLIVLMENGAIVATGTHEELLAAMRSTNNLRIAIGRRTHRNDRNGGGRMTAATQASTQADKTTIRGRLAARKPIAPPQQQGRHAAGGAPPLAYMASGESRREFIKGLADPPDRRAGPGGHAVLHRPWQSTW
jgi:ABC-type multidrug transport system ATPase subunit